MKTVDSDRTKLEAYAWPGGYPVCYVAADGWRNEDGSLEVYRNSENACCAKCAADVAEWPDMVVTGSYIHYEGPAEYCEYCNGLTESAYGDPSADDSDGPDGPEQNMTEYPSV